MKFRERHTVEQRRNPIIKAFIDSLPPEEVAVAVKTIIFIKQQFPEAREILQGEIIQEESWE